MNNNYPIGFWRSLFILWTVTFLLAGLPIIVCAAIIKLLLF